ncbi:MAG: glycosyltransferase family 4 protein [Acetivibrio ethanolgignens]
MKVIKSDKIKVYIPDDERYTKNKKFTAHIIVRYDSGHCGGIDPHIIGICKYQKRNENIMPLLIIVSRNKNVINDYKDLGIAYVDCTNCTNNYETAIQVKALLKYLDIVIVHSHGYSTNYFLFMLKKLDPRGFNRIKTVVTCHGWVEFNINKKLLTFLDFFTYRMADALICVSETGIKRLEKYRKKKIVRAVRNGIIINPTIVGNSIVEDFFLKYNIQRNKNIISFVGRLDEEKRPDRFILFASMLAKLRNDLHFLIVGDGILKEKMKKLSKKIDIDSCVTFTGEIFPPSVVYQISKFIYLSSDTEGIPMCVLESMSFGTPVLASDVGGLNEVIDSGVDGYLFRKENLQAVVECANYLLNNPKHLTELGENSICKIKERFSAERMHIQEDIVILCKRSI